MSSALLQFIFLALAAFCAGAMNAIAGGGTLLTFPALLAVISPVLANGTSTVALLPGSIASALAYRTELARVRPMLILLFAPSLAGGICGSLMVTRFPEKVFADLVPWLLLLAATLLMLQRPVAKWIGAHPHVKPANSTKAAVIGFQFLVAVYGGYFGAGIGILMLSSLAFMGISDIHEMNALKTVLASLINGVSAVVFIMEGAVVWRFAPVMIVCSIAGGYAGARVARKMPQNVVRSIVIGIGLFVAAYSFYKNLTRH
ncbi:MAG TPA: sulfite exporter TauE/SafE family protein [Bryobacteraceae bacterium]